MSLPRLHVVTDDEVLTRMDFAALAGLLLQRYGDRIALHLRGPRTPVRPLFDLARELVPLARESGARLLVNDRVDVALASPGAGVQLGARSLPVQAVRSLLGGGAPVGYSAHDPAEAASALGNGADFVLLGTIWATASHPDRLGAGPARIREAVRLAAGPVIAIGGVGPERAIEAVHAGAYGVAAIRGIWDAEDPIEAAGTYLDSWR